MADILEVGVLTRDKASREMKKIVETYDNQTGRLIKQVERYNERLEDGSVVQRRSVKLFEDQSKAARNLANQLEKGILAEKFPRRLDRLRNEFESMKDSIGDTDLLNRLNTLVDQIPEQKLKQKTDKMSGHLAVFSKRLLVSGGLITGAVESIKAGLDLTEVEQSFDFFTRRVGVSSSGLESKMRSLSQGVLTANEIMEKANFGLAVTKDVEIMNRQLEVSRKIALAFGRRTVEVFERISGGSAKMETELFDDLGILIKVAEATNKFSQETGKLVSEMTEQERVMSFTNLALEKAEATYGDINTSLTTTKTRFQQLVTTGKDTLAFAGKLAVLFGDTLLVGIDAVSDEIGVGLIGALDGHQAATEASRIANENLNLSLVKLAVNARNAIRSIRGQERINLARVLEDFSPSQNFAARSKLERNILEVIDPVFERVREHIVRTNPFGALTGAIDVSEDKDRFVRSLTDIVNRFDPLISKLDESQDKIDSVLVKAIRAGTVTASEAGKLKDQIDKSISEIVEKSDTDKSIQKLNRMIKEAEQLGKRKTQLDVFKDAVIDLNQALEGKGQERLLTRLEKAVGVLDQQEAAKKAREAAKEYQKLQEAAAQAARKQRETEATFDSFLQGVLAQSAEGSEKIIQQTERDIQRIKDRARKAFQGGDVGIIEKADAAEIARREAGGRRLTAFFDSELRSFNRFSDNVVSKFNGSFNTASDIIEAKSAAIQSLTARAEELDDGLKKTGLTSVELSLSISQLEDASVLAFDRMSTKMNESLLSPMEKANAEAEKMRMFWLDAFGAGFIDQNELSEKINQTNKNLERTRMRLLGIKDPMDALRESFITVGTQSTNALASMIVGLDTANLSAKRLAQTLVRDVIAALIQMAAFKIVGFIVGGPGTAVASGGATGGGLTASAGFATRTTSNNSGGGSTAVFLGSFSGGSTSSTTSTNTTSNNSVVTAGGGGGGTTVVIENINFGGGGDSPDAREFARQLVPHLENEIDDGNFRVSGRRI